MSGIKIASCFIISPKPLNAYSADYPLLLVYISFSEEKAEVLKVLKPEDIAFLSLFYPYLKDNPVVKSYPKVPLLPPDTPVLPPYVEEEALKEGL